MVTEIRKQPGPLNQCRLVKKIIEEQGVVSFQKKKENIR